MGHYPARLLHQFYGLQIIIRELRINLGISNILE
jgi:hypothetical protein